MSDTDQLVISISADTAQIDRAINRLLGSVNSSTNGISTAFTRAGAAMDGAGVSATKLQQQLNSLTGVNTSMKSRADDVAAYGVQLDSIRAKYNPLFAAQQQYVKSLSDINNAAKVGAISETERVGAIMSTKVAFTQEVNTIRGVTAQYDFFNQSTGKSTKALQDNASAHAGMAIPFIQP